MAAFSHTVGLPGQVVTIEGARRATVQTKLEERDDTCDLVIEMESGAKHEWEILRSHGRTAIPAIQRLMAQLGTIKSVEVFS